MPYHHTSVILQRCFSKRKRIKTEKNPQHRGHRCVGTETGWKGGKGQPRGRISPRSRESAPGPLEGKADQSSQGNREGGRSHQQTGRSVLPRIIPAFWSLFKPQRPGVAVAAVSLAAVALIRLCYGSELPYATVCP